MTNSTNENLKTIIETHKQKLIEEITAAYKQLGTSLSEVDRLRINRQIAYLETELAKIQNKIDSLANDTAKQQVEDQTNNKLNQKAKTMDRKTLYTQLTALVPGQFNQLLFEIKSPPGLIPSTPATQAERVYALLQWAESPTGCGLGRIEEVLKSILNPQ